MTNQEIFEQYKIKKLPRSKQDMVMHMMRYLITIGNESFIGRRYDNHRTDHVYFNDETQQKIDGNILDMIEKDICSQEVYAE